MHDEESTRLFHFLNADEYQPYHPNTSTSHHIISQHTHNVITLSFKESTHQNGTEAVYNRYWAKSFKVLHFDDRKTIDFAMKYNYVNKIDLLMKSLMFQKRWMLPNKKSWFWFRSSQHYTKEPPFQENSDFLFPILNLWLAFKVENSQKKNRN